MKHLLAIPALLFASHTFAECPATLPQSQPVIPDGATVSHEVMYEAQEAVREYVETIEQYLECRAGVHPLQNARYVYLAETVADAYNAELNEFRARDNMVATN